MLNELGKRTSWNRIDFTEDQIKGICASYERGDGARPIADRIQVNPLVIDRVLKENSITRRSRSEQNKTCFVDTTVFDNITEESAYWLGMLLADGAITCNKNKNWLPVVALVLQPQDADHVYKYKSFLKSTYTVCITRNGFARHAVSSKVLVEKLRGYNIVPNKSFIATAPDLLVDNKDFWRGVVDGNGYIDIKRKGIELCGSYNLTSQFREYVKKHVSTNAVVRKTRSVFRFTIYGGKTATKILELLYKDATISLERKKRKADYIIKGVYE